MKRFQVLQQVMTECWLQVLVDDLVISFVSLPSDGDLCMDAQPAMQVFSYPEIVGTIRDDDYISGFLQRFSESHFDPLAPLERFRVAI